MILHIQGQSVLNPKVCATFQPLATYSTPHDHLSTPSTMRTAALLSLLFTVNLANAQDSDASALSKALKDATLRASQGSVEELWLEAHHLSEVSLDFEEVNFDRLVDDALSSAKGASAKLFLSAIRLDGEDAPVDEICSGLQSIINDNDGELRMAALSLLQRQEFRNTDPDVLEVVISKLLERASNADTSPKERMEFAVTAHMRGSGEARRTARRVLIDFLNSSDPSLRGRAALSLARMGDLNSAQDELSALAARPGRDGQLAAAHLRSEEVRRHLQRELLNQRRMYTELLDSEPSEDESSADDRVEQLIRLIQARHLEAERLEHDDLIEAALSGMLKSLDQHSSYMSSEAYEKFSNELQAIYGGIGAYVGMDPDTSIFTITRPIFGGPAYRAKLKKGDRIVQIGDWSTIGKEQDDIIRKLKGEPGSEVKIYVWRDGDNPDTLDRPTEEMAMNIKRELITIPTVFSEMLPGGIGLVELTQFNEVASREVGKALEGLLEDGARGIILDLRSNPGGLLREARGISDLFLPRNKLVVTTDSRIQEPEELFTRRPSLVPEDMPVVVLVNRYSASASEIVSGALQDHGRATIIGQRTFGKGSVQNLLPFGRDDVSIDENRNRRHDEWEELADDQNENGKFDFAPRVKLTIARYLLPSGRSIHREVNKDGTLENAGGVEPDLAIGPRRWESWQLREITRLNKLKSVEKYAESLYTADPELMEALAICDNRSTVLYEGFEEFFSSLNTTLPTDDVRLLVRREIRRSIQDKRGFEYPRGDFEEDAQVQEAIRTLFDQLEEDPMSIPVFAATFLPEGSTELKAPTALAAREKFLRDAQILLTEARLTEDLDAAALDQIQELLDQLGS